MKNKRGQLTIFIIVAILIIAGIVLFLTLKDKKVSNETNYPTQATPIVNYVQQCLDTVSKEVVYDVAEGGGYYLPLHGLSTEDLGIAYYKKGDSYHIPSQDKIEQEMSKYILINFLNCTNNFSTFKDYKIDRGKPVAKTQITQDNVNINLYYPLTIKKGNFSFEINSFNTKFESPFGLLYDSAKEYIKQESTGKDICITCVLDIEKEFNVDISSLRLGNNTVMFVFTDVKQRDLDPGEKIKYAFANEY